MCSGAAVEDVKMDEIVAQAEENIVENEVPIIEADNSARYLSDSSGEAPDNDELFDLFVYNDKNKIEMSKYLLIYQTIKYEVRKNNKEMNMMKKHIKLC